MGFGLWNKTDKEALARSWRGSQPFPHLVIDDFVDADRLEELRHAANEEPLLPQADEHFQFRGSVEPFSSEILRAFYAELAGSSMRATMEVITGIASNTLSMRVYRYIRGDYLLPHTDSRPEENRVIAFAFYLGPSTGEPMEGGELQLYRCALEGNLITSATAEVTIPARPNRIALFGVSPATLHRVCEVTSGDRLSLAGWFVA